MRAAETVLEAEAVWFRAMLKSWWNEGQGVLIGVETPGHSCFSFQCRRFTAPLWLFASEACHVLVAVSLWSLQYPARSLLEL